MRYYNFGKIADLFYLYNSFSKPVERRRGSYFLGMSVSPYTEIVVKNVLSGSYYNHLYIVFPLITPVILTFHIYLI